MNRFVQENCNLDLVDNVQIITNAWLNFLRDVNNLLAERTADSLPQLKKMDFFKLVAFCYHNSHILEKI